MIWLVVYQKLRKIDYTSFMDYYNMIGKNAWLGTCFRYMNMWNLINGYMVLDTNHIILLNIWI